MADKFYKIYDDILSDERLSYPEKILYGVIVRLAKNGEKQCYASNKALSEIMHCSKSSISKWLDTLTNFGYIKRTMHYVEGTKHVDKRYITPLTICASELTAYTADVQGDIPQSDKKILHDMTRGYSEELQEDTPPNYKDSKINIEREYSKNIERDKLVNKQALTATINSFHFSVNISNTIVAWTDYKLARNEIHNYEWFKGQLVMIKNTLKQHSEADVIGLIRECIQNNWKTIPFDRLSSSAQKSNNFFLNLVSSGNTENLF